jgi:hypothetical protein
MIPKRMIGKSRNGFRRMGETEKAENVAIDEIPPSRGIGVRVTLAAGRALAHHKIAQSIKKEKLMRTCRGHLKASIVTAYFHA